MAQHLCEQFSDHELFHTDHIVYLKVTKCDVVFKKIRVYENMKKDFIYMLAIYGLLMLKQKCFIFKQFQILIFLSCSRQGLF